MSDGTLFLEIPQLTGSILLMITCIDIGRQDNKLRCIYTGCVIMVCVQFYLSMPLFLGVLANSGIS